MDGVYAAKIEGNRPTPLASTHTIKKIMDLFNASDDSTSDATESETAIFNVLCGTDDGSGRSRGYPSANTYRCAWGWTACSAGNSYCGTGLASADAKDNCTGLVWSLPCNGVGCSSFSDSSPIAYTWSNGGGNNNSQTANALCSAGSHRESGWELPLQNDIMQAVIDGAHDALETGGGATDYWSQTVRSDDATVAWQSKLSGGASYADKHANGGYIRCIRSTP
ncbi:MAG: hypothetical protein ABIG34_01765 [Candidatus Peregrinibacteria bacterium]